MVQVPVANMYIGLLVLMFSANFACDLNILMCDVIVGLDYRFVIINVNEECLLL